MGSLERRVSKIEKRLGVGIPPQNPTVIYIRRFNCHASKEQIEALGDYTDWITCRQQIEAFEAENRRTLLENPWITVTVSPQREFEARGLPIEAWPGLAEPVRREILRAASQEQPHEQP